MKTILKVPLLLVSLALLVLTFAPARAQEERRVTDQEISNAVMRQLQADEGVPASRVDVSTDDGVVTLSGSVDNVLAEARAERVAESVRGVLSVVNKLTVNPIERTDRQIRDDVYAAIAANDAVGKVTIVVDDGVVTLDGEVNSWAERQIAEYLARGVRGVRRIENNLDVDFETDRPDSEIAADVRSRLRADGQVDAGDVNASVKDHKVTLTGKVGSAVEKSRASFDARVAGVDAVDDSGLEVRPGTREAAEEELTDKEIRQAVRAALRAEPGVSEADTDVEVADGVATLTGKVETVSAKRSASSAALNTRGVWRVHNYIRVRPTNERTGADIEADILAAFERDPYLDRNDIAVYVSNGQAELMGDVDSAFERSHAEAIASTINGVTDVVNGLTVDTGDLTYPSYYPYYDYGYTTAGRASQSDWEIAEDIRSELFWSPFVDSDEVNVVVEDGVATLTGTVDTWHEKKVAVKNAYDGGATNVHDRLKVESGPAYYRP